MTIAHWTVQVMNLFRDSEFRERKAATPLKRAAGALE